MKRSEANEILKSREEFSTKYEAFSLISDENDYSEEYFNTYGCSCCPDNLPSQVFDVNCLLSSDIKLKKFDNIQEVQLCGGCLVSMINGDDSDLDYLVTEEDVK